MVKKGGAIRENLIIAVALVLTLSFAVVMDHFGMPQKWHAAEAWTAVPFTTVVVILYRYWKQWRFWLSITVCLVAHIGLMWLIFGRFLADVKWIGTIYVVPFEFIEIFVLVVVVGMLMRKLGYKAKYIRI